MQLGLLRNNVLLLISLIYSIHTQILSMHFYTVSNYVLDLIIHLHHCNCEYFYRWNNPLTIELSMNQQQERVSTFHFLPVPKKFHTVQKKCSQKTNKISEALFYASKVEGRQHNSYLYINLILAFSDSKRKHAKSGEKKVR